MLAGRFSKLISSYIVVFFLRRLERWNVSSRSHNTGLNSHIWLPMDSHKPLHQLSVIQVLFPANSIVLRFPNGSGLIPLHQCNRQIHDDSKLIRNVFLSDHLCPGGVLSSTKVTSTSGGFGHTGPLQWHMGSLSWSFMSSWQNPGKRYAALHISLLQFAVNFLYIATSSTSMHAWASCQWHSHIAIFEVSGWVKRQWAPQQLTAL